MGIFNNLNKYSNVDISKYIKSITKHIQAGGPKLNANNNYDTENRKLINVADGTDPTDAITLKKLDAVHFEAVTKNIDLPDTYNVINSKQQTFDEMNANRKLLVCYEDVRDVLVSRKESVFPMQTHLDMEHNYIYNFKTPVNNDQGAKKIYVDNGFLKLSGGLMTGNLDMRNNKIFNLPTPTGNAQPTPKSDVDTNFLKPSGGNKNSREEFQNIIQSSVFIFIIHKTTNAFII